MDILTFGDLFIYNGERYAFLASNGRVTYAAKIVAQKEVRGLLDRLDHIMRQGDEVAQRAAVDNVTYCFVQLKTPGYTGDVAKLEKADEQRDEARFIPQRARLIQADMVALKQEITDGPVARGLKKLVRDIEL